jgi:aspartate 1-decarboxylase
LVQPGDLVIVIAYGIYEPSELENHDPITVHVAEGNRPLPSLAPAT